MMGARHSPHRQAHCAVTPSPESKTTPGKSKKRKSWLLPTDTGSPHTPYSQPWHATTKTLTWRLLLSLL